MGDFFESVLETATSQDGLNAVLGAAASAALIILCAKNYNESKPKESLERPKDDSKDDLDPYVTKYF